ncbi:MAG: YfhO family protein [Oscillospiraceae bacterium]|nr:YfhO family protein [Oscillospiraceae bacterium]
MIMRMKGIYPFGGGVIDVTDMSQMNVPLYYHLWDAVHGSKSLFFDWYTGLTVNMAESVGIVSLISPFNLFFLFIPREDVYLSMGMFTCIKFMASAAFMYFFLKRNFGISAFWLNVFSVCYAFSGYAVMYYSHSQWIDIMAFFPLLMHTLWRIFKRSTGGSELIRALPYTIVLAACLIINMYISIMIVLFIFFITGLYFLFITKSKACKRRVLSLGVATVAAAALSAFLLIPSYYQINASARTEFIGGAWWQHYLRIIEAPNSLDIGKWFLLFPCALPLAVIIYGVFRNCRNGGKSGKRIAAFWSCGILLAVLPVFIESTNLIWHGGNYVLFPVRFAFILTFMVVTGACYYISVSESRSAESVNFRTERVQILNDESTSVLLVRAFGIFVSVLATAWMVYKIFSQARTFQTDNPYPSIFSPELMTVAVIISIIVFVLYMLLLSKGNTIINYRAVAALLLLEVICFSYIYIGYNGNPSEYIKDTNAINAELDITADRLTRIKTAGHTLNTNYPFILARPSISNWTHTIPLERQEAVTAFGYSGIFTRMLDTGGTVFSDAIFNVRNTLSVSELDDGIYEYINSGGGYNYYKNRYTLPFGIPVNSAAVNAVEAKSNPFFFTQEVYSRVFSNLESDNERLVHIIKYNSNTDPDYVTGHSSAGRTLSLTIEVGEKKALYYAPLGDSRIHYFSVDDEIVPIPTFADKESTYFPVAFDRNVVFLGVFENQSLNIRINYAADSDVGSGMIAQLDLGVMSKLTEEWADFETNARAGKRNLSLNVNSADEYHDLLFLPISYDSGWDCKVNGEKVTLEKVLGSFIGVPIKKGGNDIQMSFTPQGMLEGIAVSGGTLLLIAAFLLFSRNKRIANKTVLNDAADGAYILYMVLWFGFMTVLYFIPIGYSVIRKLFLV